MPGSPGRDKMGRDTKVSLPLLTPQPFLRTRLPSVARLNGGRGLGSVRRAAFGTLSGPEFTLRKPPRITVRGQTVQGVRLVLRKAPLPSMVCPWSTKRHCGPLAFRRATEGSRGLKEGLGESRGGKGTIRCPCPLLFPPVNTGNPPAAGRRHFSPAVGTALPAGEHRHLRRRAAAFPPAVGTAPPPPDGGVFPKPRGRFGQRTNSPSIFQLSMFAIDISYFPWYS